MDWTSIYQSRITPREEAVQMHQIGDAHLSHRKRIGASESARRAGGMRLRTSERGDLPGADDRPRRLCEPGNGRSTCASTRSSSATTFAKRCRKGRADFTPVLLSEFPLFFKRGILPLDVAIIHVSPPDEHGFCSFGVEVGLTKSPGGIGEDHHCRSQPADAAHTGQFIHPCQPLEPHHPGQLSNPRNGHGGGGQPGSCRKDRRLYLPS